MSLQRLATVEVQMIMRCCDHVSLLRLARCNKQLRGDASSSFAWSAPVCVDLHALVAAAEHASRQKQKGFGAKVLQWIQWHLLYHKPVVYADELIANSLASHAGLGIIVARQFDLDKMQRLPIIRSFTNQTYSIAMACMFVLGTDDDRIRSAGESKALARYGELHEFIQWPAYIHTSFLHNLTNAQPNLRRLQIWLNSLADANRLVIEPPPIFPNLTELTMIGHRDSLFVHTWLMQGERCFPQLQRLTIETQGRWASYRLPHVHDLTIAIDLLYVGLWDGLDACCPSLVTLHVLVQTEFVVIPQYDTELTALLTRRPHLHVSITLRTQLSCFCLERLWRVCAVFPTRFRVHDVSQQRVASSHFTSTIC